MDMENIAKIHAVLAAAESELVDLANVASGSRDYDSAATVIALAQAIKRLQEEYGLIASVQPSKPNNSVSRPAASPMANNTASAVHNSKSRRTKTASSRISQRLDAYPRFHVINDNLIKVGWSKKQKAEYEHKCPKSVLESLVSALVSISRKGSRFSTEDIIPLTDLSDNTEAPTYQVYVALAWLRAIGLIEQHGRQGYSLSDVDLSLRVEDAWMKL